MFARLHRNAVGKQDDDFIVKYIFLVFVKSSQSFDVVVFRKER